MRIGFKIVLARKGNIIMTVRKNSRKLYISSAKLVYESETTVISTIV